MQSRQRDARLDTANDVHPFNLGIVEVRDIGDDSHGLKRQVKVRGSTCKAIAEVALGRDADDGDRLRIDAESAAHNIWIAGIVVRPGVIAHHGSKRGALSIVSIGKEAAGDRLKAECPEVIAGDELTHDRLCHALGVFATGRKRPVIEACFHRRQFLEFRHILLHQQVRVCREERVIAIVLRAGVDAAIVSVPNANESLRIHDRQIAQQHGMDQRKDGSVRANAESQRKDHGDGEARRLPQLAQRISKILDQNPHQVPPHTQWRAR